MTQHKLLDAVSTCIRRECLAEAGQHIYVAVSGGTDSVALLAALYLLGYRLSILHCNFHLRGDESLRDERFVLDLATKLGLPYMVKHYDTQAYATERGLSIEMAARELRYSWFEQILSSDHDARIAIAHNADDVLETFLLNLSKGTGIRGLSGMPYRRNGGLIRPLMDASRLDIEDFLRHNPICNTHVEDSSNKDLIYQRNYIRHHLLPAFGTINPNYRQSMGQTVRYLRGAEAFYRESIERYKAEVFNDECIDIPLLLETPDPMTLLFEILRPYNFSSKQCEEIAALLPSMRSGASFISSSNRLVCSWKKLELMPLQTFEFTPRELAVSALPYSVSLPRGKTLSLTLAETIADPTLPNVLYIPMQLLKGQTLSLRSYQEGERMKPFGMKHGSKKISRILIDNKVSQREREEALVLCLGNDILWLLELSKSEYTRLPNHSTGAYLKLSIS